ncbi:MAG: hypothetical protein AB2L14_21130 [Candidatus Xenobiia bacterium LiM19]
MNLIGDDSEYDMLLPERLNNEEDRSCEEITEIMDGLLLRLKEEGRSHEEITEILDGLLFERKISYIVHYQFTIRLEDLFLSKKAKKSKERYLKWLQGNRKRN